MNASAADRRSGTTLRAESIHLSYRGAPAVADAAISVSSGRVTALVGPNGSGKSTLLRGLSRLHQPDGGTVAIEETLQGAQPVSTDVHDLSAKQFARRVTMLSQQRPTPGGVLVRDVVGYGRHPYTKAFGRGDPNGRAAIEHAMELTGVLGMSERPVDALSGGELQRVWLATCLAQDTSVLLLDEPTNHLDLRYQAEILDLMRELADDHGIAVGVVLHDLNQAASVADEVVLMSHGRVQLAGPASLVLTEEQLSAAYDVPVAVHTDPVTGVLTCRPIGRRASRITLAG